MLRHCRYPLECSRGFSSYGLVFFESDTQVKHLGRDVILYAVRKQSG